MQFARILVFLFAALVSAVAIPDGGSHPPPPQGGCNQAQVVQCCIPISTNSGGGLLGGISLLNNLATCASIVPIGSGCKGTQVCCDVDQSGLVNVNQCGSIL
ncbi:hypothetical protein B9Z19DRAFT_1123297 [Tuber borchii]|uniref:Hydrophobin n=1 Tax=Tuber borchii TaxID=42251 RepID=A0A2T6ZYN4_TUBBO|nr:hypothetical protein B9Z19DRAFT_1123297 [Tuber borchii]